MTRQDDRRNAAKAALERRPTQGTLDVIACDFCGGPVVVLELGDKHEVHCGRCKSSYECDALGRPVDEAD